MSDTGLVLLMELAKTDGGVEYWQAVNVRPLGRVLTRRQARWVVSQRGPSRGPLVLLPYFDAREKFARAESPSSFAVLPGESITETYGAERIDLPGEAAAWN